MSRYESLRMAASAVEMADEWYTKKTIFSFPNYECDEDFVVEASPERVLALIAENESLRKDAQRYRWLCSQGWFDNALESYGGLEILDCDDYIDASIDAAMGKGEQS